jgi:hypothetical protein
MLHNPCSMTPNCMACSHVTTLLLLLLLPVLAATAAVGPYSLMPLVEQGQHVGQHCGVLAAGCCHCDTFAAFEQAVCHDGLVHLILQGCVEALLAELRGSQETCTQGSGAGENLEA